MKRNTSRPDIRIPVTVAMAETLEPQQQQQQQQLNACATSVVMS
jgi:hypothetical protein